MSWEDGGSSNCHRTPLDDSGIAVDHEEGGEVKENSNQSESMLLLIHP